MRPIRSIATALLVASLALAGCGTGDGGRAGPPAAPPGGAPVTVAPTTPPPRRTNRPPGAAEALATAVSFMRREVGMLDPVAGPFRPTGDRTGQVDVRARIADDVSPLRGPVTTVSLRRLTEVWYVLGARTDAIRVVRPVPQDPVRSPLEVMASLGGGEHRVHVRVTQDRYGEDVELGSGYLIRWTDESPDVSGLIPFRRPSRAAGSVVLTIASGHNGEVRAATVVRVRFATAQPPQILGVRSTPRLPGKDAFVALPEVLTVQVTATRVARARLVFAATGTGMAWSSRVVAEDRNAGDGLRLTWRPDKGTLGHLWVEVLGPGGTATKQLGGVHRE